MHGKDPSKGAFIRILFNDCSLYFKFYGSMLINIIYSDLLAQKEIPPVFMTPGSAI